jgi:hypothetical protein
MVYMTLNEYISKIWNAEHYISDVHETYLELGKSTIPLSMLDSDDCLWEFRVLSAMQHERFGRTDLCVEIAYDPDECVWEQLSICFIDEPFEYEEWNDVDQEWEIHGEYAK